MRGSVVIAGVLTIGCGGGSATGPSDAGSPPDIGAYQTAQGFCTGPAMFAGGDLVGTWQIVAACGISTGAPANCANTAVSLSLEAGGTVTFNADKTGSIDVTVTIKKTSAVPLACAAAGDCATLQAALTTEVGTDAGASATCAVSSTDATRCACAQSFAPHAFQGTGTYQLLRPNYLESSGLHLQGGFEVQGRTLRLDGLAVYGTEFDLIAER